MKHFLLAILVVFSTNSLQSMEEVKLTPQELRNAREYITTKFQAPNHLKGVKRLIAKYPLLSAQMAFYIPGAFIGGVLGLRMAIDLGDPVSKFFSMALLGGSAATFVTYGQGATHDLAATLLELVAPEEFEQALHAHVPSLKNKNSTFVFISPNS